MALKNIEYGSLASSSDLNSNFNYLDNRISDSAEDINTSISSILSNIATINTNLTELADDLSDSISEISAELNDFKTKSLILINKSSMLPDWGSCASISKLNNYEVTSNGYVLIITTTDAHGNLTVNGKNVVFKRWSTYYDNGSLLVCLPVQAGDVLNASFGIFQTYFVPCAQFTLNDDE